MHNTISEPTIQVEPLGYYNMGSDRRERSNQWIPFIATHIASNSPIPTLNPPKAPKTRGYRGFPWHIGEYRFLGGGYIDFHREQRFSV